MTNSEINKAWRVCSSSHFLLVVLLTASFFFRLFYLLNTDNYYLGESYHRLLHVIRWLEEPKLSTGDWLPLFPWLYGAIIWVTNDVTYAPRLFTTFLSLLTFFPLLYLTKQLFSRFTSRLVLLFYATSGFFIVVATVTLTETLYTFLVLSTFATIHRLSVTRSIGFLLLASLLVNATCMLRYEGIILYFCSLLFLSFRLRLIQLIWFALLGCLAILFVLIDGYRLFGNPLGAILYSDKQVTQTISVFSIGWQETIDSFANIIPIVLWPYLLIGLWLEVVKSIHAKKISLLLCVCLFAIPTLYKVLEGSLLPMSRYYSSFSLLFVGLGLTGLSHCFDFLTPKSEKHYLPIIKKTTIAGLILASILYTQYVFFIPNKTQNIQRTFPEGLFQSAQWANRNLKNAKLAVDFADWQEGAWLTHAKRDPSYTKIVEVCQFGGLKHVHAGPTKENLNRCLNQKEITHLVLMRNGYAKKYLPDSRNRFTYGKYKFFLIHEVEGYEIYRAIKLETPITEKQIN